MTQQTQPKSVVKSFFKWLLIFGLLSACGIAIYLRVSVIPNLPDPSSLNKTQLQTPLSIYSAEGFLIAKFGEKKRLPVAFDDIPPAQIHAFLAAEDKGFFQHSGIDFGGLARAAGQLLLTGEKKQGGSTITMQVARNFFLSKEKTYLRKLREILLSIIIERQLSKQEILTLYLNKIYLGHRSYGIAAAAEVYYDKKLAQLSLAQQAMIAGLPKAPSALNPITNPSRALIRRNYVLNRLLHLNYISQEQYDTAFAEPLSAKLHSATVELEAPYVAEMVRNKMSRQYGNEIYTSGMHVYTTIKATQQKAANRAVKNALHQYDRRHGYRGVLGHVDTIELAPDELDLTPLAVFKNIGDTKPAIVTGIAEKSISVTDKNRQTFDITWENLKWARPYINENKRGKRPVTAAEILVLGDIIRIRQKPNTETYELAQVPNVSGAIVAIAPYNGALTALVGGYDYYSGKFNRAYQADRQPGSGFKPILYSAALSKGYTTATLINDAPVVFNDAGLEQHWRPENYSGKFFGPTRLREALIHSRNLVSIRIMRDIGVTYVRNFAARFGFKPSLLPRNLSLALGSGSANPYKMATAYSVFANGGFSIQPHFISRIVSYSDEVLFKANPAIAIEREETSLTDQDATLLDEENTHSLADRSMTTMPLKNNGVLMTAPALPVIKRAERVMSPQLNFIVSSLLRDVIKRGTGRRALSIGRSDLAGKTGTTNDQRDAWFNGFNPSLVAVTWVGFDNNKPLGDKETGGRAALPIWMSFMKEALKDTPNMPLSQPEGIVGLLIDSETGLKTNPSNKKAIFEFFREKNIPASDSRSVNKNSSAVDRQQAIDELF